MMLGQGQCSGDVKTPSDDAVKDLSEMWHVIVYCNGFTIDDDRFYPMSNKRVKQFVTELKKKQIPNELHLLRQQQGHDVPLVVKDKHAEEYKSRPWQCTNMRLQQKLQQRREDRAKRAERATVSLPLEVAFVDESWMDEDSKKTNTKSRAKASKAKKVLQCKSVAERRVQFQSGESQGRRGEQTGKQHGDRDHGAAQGKRAGAHAHS